MVLNSVYSRKFYSILQNFYSFINGCGFVVRKYLYRSIFWILNVCPIDLSFFYSYICLQSRSNQNKVYVLPNSFHWIWNYLNHFRVGCSYLDVYSSLKNVVLYVVFDGSLFNSNGVHVLVVVGNLGN